MTRKNITQGYIYKLTLLPIFLFQIFFALAQKPDIIQPGSTSINTALLNTGSFVWEEQVSSLFNFGKPIKPKKFFVTINRTAKEIIIDERITDVGKNLVKRKYVVNAKTFEPIRAESETENFSYNVEFGSKIKGVLEKYTTGEKERYDDPIEGGSREARSSRR